MSSSLLRWTGAVALLVLGPACSREQPPGPAEEGPTRWFSLTSLKVVELRDEATPIVMLHQVEELEDGTLAAEFYQLSIDLLVAAGPGLRVSDERPSVTAECFGRLHDAGRIRGQCAGGGLPRRGPRSSVVLYGLFRISDGRL